METIDFIDKYTAWGGKCEKNKVLWVIWVYLKNYLSIQGKIGTLIWVKERVGVWLCDTRIEATVDHQQFDEINNVLIEKCT